MRFNIVLGVLLIGTLACAATPTAPTSLLEKAAGEWVVESAKGKVQEGRVFVEMVGKPLLIKGDRLSWIETSGRDERGRRNWHRLSRKLVPRPDVAPNAVDLKVDGPYKGWSRIAILEVVDDELHLCVNFPQMSRPEKFDEADDGRELVVLRRVKDWDE